MHQEMAASKAPWEPTPKFIERDPLTELLGREATQKQIGELLRVGGVLLLLGTDNLKQINERCGHLEGDRCLKEIAQTLQLLFFKQDVLGRFSGDTFAIYLNRACTEDFLIRKVEQLNERLKRPVRKTDCPQTQSLTVGAAIVQAGDSVEALFARAEQALVAGKKTQNGGICFYSPALQPSERPACPREAEGGVCMDMELIRRDLREASHSVGAYCQAYENFKVIYRFVERGLHRSGRSAYTILLTLTDGAGDFLPLEQREPQLERLRATIQGCLRSGDVFTQYSSSQYLLMVLDTSAENAGGIGTRIRERFGRGAGGPGLCLQQSVYPLHSVGEGTEENPG